MDRTNTNQPDAINMASDHPQHGLDSPRSQSPDAEDQFVDCLEEQQEWGEVLETQPRKERVLAAPEIEMSDADAKAFMQAEAPAPPSTSAQPATPPAQLETQASTPSSSPAKAVPPPTPELKPRSSGYRPRRPVYLPPPGTIFPPQRPDFVPHEVFPPPPVCPIPQLSDAQVEENGRRAREHDEQARKNREIAASRPPRHLRPTPLSMVTDPVVSAAQSGSSMAIGFLRRQIGLEDRTGYRLVPQDDPNSPRLIEEGWFLPDEGVTAEDVEAKKEAKDETAEDEKTAKGEKTAKDKKVAKGEKTPQDHIQEDWHEVPDIYCRLPSREYPPPPTALDRGMELVDTAHATVIKGVNTATRVIFKNL